MEPLRKTIYSQNAVRANPDSIRIKGRVGIKGGAILICDWQKYVNQALKAVTHQSNIKELEAAKPTIVSPHFALTWAKKWH